MAQVIVKLDTAEFEQVCRAAEFYGKEVTEFMHEAVLKAAAHPRFKVLRATDGFVARTS